MEKVNPELICAVKKCGKIMRHTIHCPYWWGAGICMEHCEKCRYHNNDSPSFWCLCPPRQDKPPEGYFDNK